MTIKPQYLTIGLIALIVVLGFFLLKTLFSGKGSSDDKLVKELLASKDSIIASKNENIVLHERIIEEIDRANEVLNEKDSMLNAHSQQIELNYKLLNEKLANIPARINRISANGDSIRTAFKEF